MNNEFNLEEARNMNILQLFIDVYNQSADSGIVLVMGDETLASKVDSYTHQKKALEMLRAVKGADFNFSDGKRFIEQLTDLGVIVILLISGANPLIFIPESYNDYQKGVLEKIQEYSGFMNRLASMGKIRFTPAFKMDKGGLFEAYVYKNGLNNLTVEDVLKESNEKVK